MRKRRSLPHADGTHRRRLHAGLRPRSRRVVRPFRRQERLCPKRSEDARKIRGTKSHGRRYFGREDQTHSRRFHRRREIGSVLSVPSLLLYTCAERELPMRKTILAAALILCATTLQAQTSKPTAPAIV